MTFLHLLNLSTHKQYCHIPPSAHPQYKQAFSSYSSICSTSIHTNLFITFLNLLTLSTRKQYYHILPHAHPHYKQAFSSYSTIGSTSIHTNLIITFLHLLTHVHTSSIIASLHLFTLSTHKQQHHIPPSAHPHHTQTHNYSNSNSTFNYPRSAVRFLFGTMTQSALLGFPLESHYFRNMRNLSKNVVWMELILRWDY